MDFEQTAWKRNLDLATVKTHSACALASYMQRFALLAFTRQNIWAAYHAAALDLVLHVDAWKSGRSTFLR